MNDHFLFTLTTTLMFALGYSVGRLHGLAQAFSFVKKQLLNEGLHD